MSAAGVEYVGQESEGGLGMTTHRFGARLAHLAGANASAALVVGLGLGTAVVFAPMAVAAVPPPPPSAGAAQPAPRSPESPVQVSIAADRGEAVDGNSITYTVRVRNTGAQPVVRAEVYQMMPKTLVFGSAGSGGNYAHDQVTWITDLAAGQEVALSMTAETDHGADARRTELVTTACVRTTPGQPLADCASSRMLWANAGSGFGGAAVWLALAVAALAGAAWLIVRGRNTTGGTGTGRRPWQRGGASQDGRKYAEGNPERPADVDTAV